MEVLARCEKRYREESRKEAGRMSEFYKRFVEKAEVRRAVCVSV
jgi:hypothetical protein